MIVCDASGNGFYKCSKKCDLCKHSGERKVIKSLWDGRSWVIRDQMNCNTKNVIYIVECDIHKKFMYVGSTVDLKKRWANHKSDSKLKKSKKCHVAKHFNEVDHPNIDCIKITPIEIVRNINNMARRELYWQANLGTFEIGCNDRKDIPTVLKNRIQYSIN